MSDIADTDTGRARRQAVPERPPFAESRRSAGTSPAAQADAGVSGDWFLTSGPSAMGRVNGGQRNHESLENLLFWRNIGSDVQITSKTKDPRRPLSEAARKGASAGLRAIEVRPRGIPAAPSFRGCPTVRLNLGLSNPGPGNVERARNEMAVKSLKSNDSAKSLILHS